jgi:hypothetical protein
MTRHTTPKANDDLPFAKTLLQVRVLYRYWPEMFRSELQL